MAMHAARRVALQQIYCQLLGGEDCASILKDQEDSMAVGEDQPFIDQALLAVEANKEHYGQLVQSYSKDRALDRIPLLDRSILFLALYELSLPDNLPSVIVNEAVELAKRFGEEADRRFVNGVLGNYLRDLNA